MFYFIKRSIWTKIPPFQCHNKLLRLKKVQYFNINLNLTTKNDLKKIEAMSLFGNCFKK